MKVGLWRRLRNLWALSTYTLPENPIDQKHTLYHNFVKKRKATIVEPHDVLDKVDV